MAELPTQPRFTLTLTYRITNDMRRYYGDTLAEGEVNFNLERLNARDLDNLLGAFGVALSGAYDRAEENSVTLATERLAAETAAEEIAG